MIYHAIFIVVYVIDGWPQDYQKLLDKAAEGAEAGIRVKRRGRTSYFVCRKGNRGP